MAPGWFTLALEVSIVTAGAAVMLSIVQWTLTSPWWHDPVGRTVITKDFGMLVLLIPNTLSIFFRHAIPFMVILWCDLVSLVIVTFAMGWRVAVWYKVRHPMTPAALFRLYRKIRQDAKAVRADKDS